MGRLNLTTLLAMSLTPLVSCTPKTADTDSGDGTIEIIGGVEDADGDSILDEHEGTDDADGDGLSDTDEAGIYGTDPHDRDSDGDGYTDGAEVTGGSDPLDSGSDLGLAWVVINDWAATEHILSVELDVEYVDLAFVLDTTCSNAGVLTSAALGFADIAAGLGARVDSPMYGVATFDDYNYSGMGSNGDKPFTLNQQITDDEGLLESTLEGLGIHSGLDAQESGMEALYQALTGAGYDQDCYGSYTSSTDVRPFVADPKDPFGGIAGGAGAPAGVGDIGGMGFRLHALPILLYATDTYIRDPDSTNSTLAVTPGGCPIDAASSDVARAVAALGAYLIGFDISGASTLYGPLEQMEALALATGSLADMDGDGDADDPLVISANQSLDDFAVTFKEESLLALERLLDSVVWGTVAVEVTNDPAGLVTSVSPEVYSDVETSTLDTLDFTLSLDDAAAPAAEDDQHFLLSFYVIGNDSVLLNTYDVVLTVSGAP